MYLGNLFVHEFMVRYGYPSVLLTGLEPATYSLGGSCSSIELQKHSTESVGIEPTGGSYPICIQMFNVGSNDMRPSPRLELNQHTTQYLSVQACHRAYDHFRRAQTMTTTTVLFRYAEGRFQIHLMYGRLRIHHTPPQNQRLRLSSLFPNSILP